MAGADEHGWPFSGCKDVLGPAGGEIQAHSYWAGASVQVYWCLTLAEEQMRLQQHQAQMYLKVQCAKFS